MTQDQKTAFVLGGGGGLGGYQVGMVQALFEAGVKPDIVIGTSIGSIQGAILAANPTISACVTLAQFWMDFVSTKAMSPSLKGMARTLGRGQAGVTSDERVREVLDQYLGEGATFEDLKIPFECAAASVERATVQYFNSGPLLPALLASSRVPGLWPPVEIDGEHYLDGGLIDSIPVGRASSMGATRVYVLPLRQSSTALSVPKLPWQIISTAFEVSRRAQVAAEMHRPRPHLTMHVLPSGEDQLESSGGKVGRTRNDLSTVRRRITIGYESATRFLAEHPEAALPTTPPKAA